MVYVKYFAKYRDWLGTAAETVTPAPPSLEALKKLIRESHPNALKMLEDSRCIVAVNQVVIQSENPSLQAGDEVAFFPPVTGG